MTYSKETKACQVCGAVVTRPKKYSQKQWDGFSFCSRKCMWGANYKPELKRRKKVAFVWQGVSDPKIFSQWNDGLREAMRIVNRSGFQVKFYEPWHDIKDVDIILYWEAPVTFQGHNGPHYNKVRENPIKKALLFAGGPIKKEWVQGFDLLFLESKVNEKECDDLGIPWRHAFGINDRNFVYKRHINPKKVWDGMLAGTGASWKRQWLIGEALGDKAILMGRDQDTDPMPFRVCREHGSTVLPEQSSSFVARTMRESHTCVNPCDFWGGGQRATLESMAMGLPVICCDDSPKNREFVEESGFGRVVGPNVPEIRAAVAELKANPLDPMIGVDYVKNKWSAKIYAKQLIDGMNEILNNK